METSYSYLKSAFYSIRKNKIYSAFSIIGAALTFVFITILVQLYGDIANNNPPFVNAGKEIHLHEFKDNKGHNLGGIPFRDIPLLLKEIKDYESCVLYDMQCDNIFTNNTISTGFVGFVNESYWSVNAFDFVKGRGFTKEEIEKYR